MTLLRSLLDLHEGNYRSKKKEDKIQSLFMNFNHFTTYHFLFRHTCEELNITFETSQRLNDNFHQGR